MTTTVNELVAVARSRLGTSFDFGLLFRIVEAEMQAVERAAGADAAAETFVHEVTLPTIISVLRPISSVTEVAERWTLADAPLVLAGDDFRQLDEWRLLRLADGTNPAYTWGQQVTVNYDAVLDQALRDRVVLDLVVLSARFRTEKQKRLGENVMVTDVDYVERREALLSQLTEGRALVL